MEGVEDWCDVELLTLDELPYFALTVDISFMHQLFQLASYSIAVVQSATYECLHQGFQSILRYRLLYHGEVGFLPLFFDILVNRMPISLYVTVIDVE